MPVAYGFFVLTSQAVLVRELLDLLRGNEAAVGILLFAWLAGSGLGAGVLRRRFRPEALMSAAALVLFAAVPASRLLAGALRYQAAPGFLAAFGGAVLITLPVSFLAGACFSALAAGRGGGVTRVYFLESAGAFLGGLAYVFLAGRVDSLEISFFLLLGAGFAAAAAGRMSPRVRAAAFLACLGGLAFWLAERGGLVAASRALGFPGSRVAYSAASRYGNLVVTRREGMESTYYGGRILYSSQDSSLGEAAALPLLAAESCGRALAAGFPAPAAVRALLDGGCRSLTAVFPDRSLEVPLQSGTGKAEAGRIRIVLEDPYRYSSRASGIFDLILVSRDFPASAADSRYFSRDFYRNLARLAGRRGVVALALDYEEDAPDPRTLRRLAAVGSVLRDSFAYVDFVPAVKFHFLASNSPLAVGGPAAIERLGAAGFEWKLVNEGYVRHYFAESRRERFRDLMSRYAPDDRGRALGVSLYRESLKEWLARDMGDTAAVAVLLVAAALYFGVRMRRRLAGRFFADARSLYIFTAGFASMGAEIQFLFYFQGASGALYYAYGLLAGAFMLGLAAGSGLAVRGRGDAFGISLLAWTALAGGLYAFPPRADSAAWYAFLLAANFWGGIGLGGLFAREAAAAARKGESGLAVSAKLYSFDLFGASLAAALTPLVSIPFLGRAGAASASFLILLAGLAATRKSRYAA